MKLDSDHVLFWMDAIRSNPNNRVLDAFWKGQINSKIWLIDNLAPYVTDNVTVDIFGGWLGTLASLIFQSSIPVTRIRSIDIDASCASIAYTINKIEEMAGRFSAITADMCDTVSDANVVINTSCEHITQDQYLQWLSGVPQTSLLVLQSNNYDIPEHIRTAQSLDEFSEQSGIDVLWSGELALPLYTRFMLIGRKK